MIRNRILIYFVHQNIVVLNIHEYQQINVINLRTNKLISLIEHIVIKTVGNQRKRNTFFVMENAINSNSFSYNDYFQLKNYRDNHFKTVLNVKKKQKTIIY